MVNGSDDNTLNTPKEISVKDIFIKTRSAAFYIKSKWKTLMLFTLLGAIAGLVCSFLIKPKYIAVCTFVLEESSKESLLSQYSGLASLAGIDLGNSGGGIFKGDNIIELYKSRAMIEKTLLTPVVFNGSEQLLIDRYIAYNHLREKWKEKDDLKAVSFLGDPEKFTRSEDSIITDLAETFNEKNLLVAKPDKKLSIIKVQVVSQDELFAKNFADKLVENVNEFYVLTRTKKTAQNVAILQHQTDSVKNALNYSINGVATAIDAAPNANPLLNSLRVPSQKKQVDVQANTAIYSEMVKNLEISKISLRQETPLIQMIDTPVLPLKTDHLGKVKGIVIGGLLGFFLVVFALLGLRILRSLSATLGKA